MCFPKNFFYIFGYHSNNAPSGIIQLPAFLDLFYFVYWGFLLFFCLFFLVRLLDFVLTHLKYVI